MQSVQTAKYLIVGQCDIKHITTVYRYCSFSTFWMSHKAGGGGKESQRLAPGYKLPCPFTLEWHKSIIFYVRHVMRKRAHYSEWSDKLNMKSQTLTGYEDDEGDSDILITLNFVHTSLFPMNCFK